MTWDAIELELRLTAYQLEGLHGARPGLAETTEPEP
jgi:hypothetical protein